MNALRDGNREMKNVVERKREGESVNVIFFKSIKLTIHYVQREC
jgi:hypothetical protein